MNRAIKYRIYPSPEQEDLFRKTFGCCRKVWNLMLSEREAAWRENGTTVLPRPARYKEEYPFLREVDSLALANVQLNLEKAYRDFFRVKGTRHPRYKSRKHARASYTTNNQHGTVALDPGNRTIRLPKAGRVRAVLHRLPEEGWELKSATVSMERDGTFFCSVLFEWDAAPVPIVPHPEENAVGLDYKSDGLYMDSEGKPCGSPKYYRKAQQRRTHAQRGLRHKKPGSRNYEKQKRRIAKIERHVANQRKEFLPTRSTATAKQYDLVAVETLNMRSMANKGFGNGKATLDNGWGVFLSMLEYKMAERGKILVRVDPWFPSSQLCHCCGHQSREVKDLRIRQWDCPACGAHHDRDHNAAINIRREGIRQYLRNREIV